jgi:peptidyl-prolyl cis-trans isomerase A (cyclophilin A)
MRRVLPFLLLCVACADDPCGGAPPDPRHPADHVLLHPDSDALKQVPPDSFDAVFETSAGRVTVRVVREWAPLGAYRFYNLARNGFYDGSRFFRVLPGFVAQFGASGDPAVDRTWLDQRLPDDPRRVPNTAGTLTFASAGPDTRTTQLFFTYKSNESLDRQGFTPIGRVVDGMEVLFRLNGDYGEVPPRGSGPSFGCILSHGNSYLASRYPRLDSIQSLRISDVGP